MSLRLDMTTVSSFSTSLSRSFKSKSSDISSVIETGSILSDMAKEFEEQKLANRYNFTTKYYRTKQWQSGEIFSNFVHYILIS